MDDGVFGNYTLFGNYFRSAKAMSETVPPPPPGYEYRIDRRHRLLRAADMFPDFLNPRAETFSDDYFACNSLKSTNLNCGKISLGPGYKHPPVNYPNEHIIVHLEGSLSCTVQGETYDLQRHDVLFIPAFEEYVLANLGNSQAVYLSGHARIVDWGITAGIRGSVGLSKEATPRGERFWHHRILRRQDMKPNRMHPRKEAFENGWVAHETLHASNTRVSLVTIEPNSGRPATHFPNEHIICVLDGRLAWRVEGQEYVLGQHDLLFIPAFTPFAYECVGDQSAALVGCYVRLSEWESDDYFA